MSRSTLKVMTFDDWNIKWYKYQMNPLAETLGCRNGCPWTYSTVTPSRTNSWRILCANVVIFFLPLWPNWVWWSENCHQTKARWSSSEGVIVRPACKLGRWNSEGWENEDSWWECVHSFNGFRPRLLLSQSGLTFSWGSCSGEQWKGAFGYEYMMYC
jgi:hypothetical protein